MAQASDGFLPKILMQRSGQEQSLSEGSNEVAHNNN
jgi:hypothetical protein